MEIIILLAVIAVGAIMIKRGEKKRKREKLSKPARAIYTYRRKYRIATNAELTFYNRLQQAIQPNEYIVPQAHLSTFLSHKIKGQNWRAAFSQINGKSVDFLIVDRETLAPIYAIEVDDSSHNEPRRIERDMLVNDIMSMADFPLIRFKEGEWITVEQIMERIRVSLL